jgi:hypothetical protein
MKICHEAQLFLAEPEPLTAPRQVRAEDAREAIIALFGGHSRRHSEVRSAAAAQQVVVERCSRRNDDRTGAQGQSSAVELYDGPVKHGLCDRSCRHQAAALAASRSPADASANRDEKSIKDERLVA